MNEFVSIIIPVYNDTDRLILCLRALHIQSYPKDLFEIIVVDNASEEKVVDIVSREFPNILLLEEPLKGSYAARNKGIQHAKGDIFVFTDSDCIPNPDWLEKGVKRLQQEPDCGLISGRIDVFYKHEEYPTFIELYEKGVAFPQELYIAKYHFSATANMFTYRRILDAVGVFNKDLKSGGDHEWGNRVFNAGFPLIYADDVCIKHPARRTWQELSIKIDRVSKGQYKINKKSHGSKLMHGLLSLHLWLPPLKKIKMILTRGTLNTLGDKTTAIMAAFMIKYYTAIIYFKLFMTE
ncbi:MAG: glycosyltransferase [Cyanobacteria bacterium J06649_11]